MAIARKLLIVVWYVLTREAGDRYVDATHVACGLFAFAHPARARNLPGEQRALEYVREQMDRLRIGQKLASLPWGTKTFRLPPSRLVAKK